MVIIIIIIIIIIIQMGPCGRLVGGGGGTGNEFKTEWSFEVYRIYESVFQGLQWMKHVD